MNKRFIEWDLPVEEISKNSAIEKSIRHGHPSTLHIWWARRPLTASRATNFAALVNLPTTTEDKEKLTTLIKKMLPWKTIKSGISSTVLEAQNVLKKQWKNIPPLIIDPFSGGGSIPLEALRLGCNVYSNDLNPVAVFIQKATLEWPHLRPIGKNPNVSSDSHNQRFLLEKVKYWALKIQKDAKEEIGMFYPEDENGWLAAGYIWARTITCSNELCQAEIPLIKHFWLARKKNKKIAYKPFIDNQRKVVQFTIQKEDQIDFNPSKGTVRKGNAHCLICNNITPAKITRNLASEGKMGERLLIVILRHPMIKGKRYRLATNFDLEIFIEASGYLKKKIQQWPWKCSPLPNESIPPAGSLGVNLESYGIKQWKDLFNNRQKLALITFLSLIKKCETEIEEDFKYFQNQKKLVQSIMGYLTLIFGRLADKNATLVVYNVYGEKIEHVFGRTALPIRWDYTELNVFSGGNGDWNAHTKWVIRFLEANLWEKTSSVIITQQSATKLSYPDSYFDAVFTDPPYYDNVPYADLSDFFYVWFKRAVGDLFPNLFRTNLTPKDEEIIANKKRQKNPKEFFEKNLELAFKEMYRILKLEGIVIIVYAHKSIIGWETMLNALFKSGFVVTASWSIQTEMKARLRAKTSSALSSSIYIVCRKSERKYSTDIRDIEIKIEEQIKTRLQYYLDQETFGGDFYIAAIGPALEIFTQYNRIISHSGEILTSNEMLKLIESISTRYIVKKLLHSKTAHKLDRYSQFYLLFRWTFMNKIIPLKSISKLAESCNITIADLKKSNDLVKILNTKLEVQDVTKRTNISNEERYIDIMHKALNFWSKKDFTELYALLNRTNMLNNTLFWQYCQAVAETLKRGNREKLLIEGMLNNMIRMKKRLTLE